MWPGPVLGAVFIGALLGACGRESQTSSNEATRTSANRQRHARSTKTSQVSASDVASTQVFQVGGDITAPQILKRVRIQVPDHLREVRRSGTVILLEGVVTTRGDVRDLRVIRGENDPLVPYVLKAVCEWRFKPAEKHGKPVAAIYPISVKIETR